MKLSTKICDSQGNQINYVVEESSGNTVFGLRTEVRIEIDNKIVGFLAYSIQDYYLYIHRMDNFSVNSKDPIKHIGSLLFEYAFHKSLEAGKAGKIELDAIDSSAAAYYRMGLRKKSNASRWMENIIEEYNANPSSEIKNKILAHDFYDRLKYIAAKKLNKQENTLSFQEVIDEGIYSEFNEPFAKELDNNNKLNKDDCCRLCMTGDMYLPSEIIKSKKGKISRIQFCWE